MIDERGLCLYPIYLDLTRMSSPNNMNLVYFQAQLMFLDVVKSRAQVGKDLESCQI